MQLCFIVVHLNKKSELSLESVFARYCGYRSKLRAKRRILSCSMKTKEDNDDDDDDDSGMS